MVRILLILLAVAAFNALAWGIGFYDAVTDMGGRRDWWWPFAKAALSMGGRVSATILQPFFWIGRFSRITWVTCVAGVLLEAVVIEVAFRLYGDNEKSPE